MLRDIRQSLQNNYSNYKRNKENKHGCTNSLRRIGLSAHSLFCFREAWKGWRTGAVDKIKKNAREPVYAYRNEAPLQFWSYVLVYAGCGCLSFGMVIYLVFYR